MHLGKENMATTQELLKKINYIEADIEIQKQILFSIPTANREDMEKTIQLIAKKKADIESLREEIKLQDPEEYQRIVQLEAVSLEFRKRAEEKKFISVSGGTPGQQCTLALADGSSRLCLVKACDEQGNWTIISAEGELLEFPAAEVTEKVEKDELDQFK